MRNLLFVIVGLAAALTKPALSAEAPAADAAPPLTLVATIPLPDLKGSSNHLAVDTKRQRFFVTAPSEKKVMVVDLQAKKVLRVLDATPAAAAIFLPDLDLLCVSGGSGVAFFSGDSLARVGEVTLNSSVDELQYDQKEKHLYVGVMDADKAGIAVIDVPTKALVTVLKLPFKPQGFVLEAGGPRVFASTPGGKQITVLDRVKRSVVAEWKLTEASSNYPVAIDESAHRLFVACRRPASVVVIDTSSGKTIAMSESGGDADDMSFDPAGHRVYVACGDGMITIVQQVDADHYRKLPNVPTRVGARNLLFANDLKTLFVVLPRQGDASAELRSYDCLR